MSDITPVETGFESQYCFYEKGKEYIHDMATLRKNGSRLACFTNMSEADLQADNKDIKLMLFDDAMAEIEKLNTEKYSAVTEITEEKYDEMLGILPPLRMFSNGFIMSEATTGAWYACYLKFNGKYYEGYTNRRTETYSQLCERFQKSIG